MNETEQRAVLTLSLMAAFADGAKDEREREQIRKIAESLSAGSSIDLAAIYQDVLLRRRTVDEVASSLTSADTRTLAYELAVCVCDADGANNDEEKRFLSSLRDALRLDPERTRPHEQAAAAIAEAALPERAPAPVAAPADPAAAAAAGARAAGPVVASQPANPAALDRSILNYSILNGALELLPQSMASMAIIPLQTKMVYEIGKAYGYELDRGHVRDLAATVGVGLTGQYVEEIARKVIGGILRRVGGSIGGALGRQATGSAMSFATTYALGQVAKAYYGGGRTIDATRLKAVFQEMLGEAKGLQARYAGEIEQKARTIDVNKLLSVMRQPV